MPPKEQLSEVNLAKFRKLQSDLEEAEARAGVAEKLVEQLRSRAISSVTGEDIDVRFEKTFYLFMFFHYS